MSVYSPERPAPTTTRDPVTGAGDQQQQPSAGTSLTDWLERKKLAEADRRRWEPIWALCNSFVAGRQWVGWDHRSERILELPNPDDRVRETANVLTQYLETFVGKVTADDLQPEVTFRLADVADRMIARQSRRVADWIWDQETEATEVVADAVRKMGTYGTSALHAYPDPGYGKPITRLPLRDGQAVPVGEAADYITERLASGLTVDYRTIREGRLCLESVAPRGVLPPPGVEHERDFPWLILQKPTAITTLVMRYGDKAKGLVEEPLRPVAFTGFRTDSSDGGGRGMGPGKLRGHVMLNIGYEAPTADAPLGQMVVWAGQQELARAAKLPVTTNGCGHIPVVFLHYHPIDGLFWSQGLIEPGIGPQRQRNRARSQWIEFKDRAGLGRVYSYKGTITEINRPKGGIFENVEILPGHDFPKETQGVPPGDWLKVEVDQNDSDLQQVMGTSGSTLAQPPAGVSAFAALALMAQQDDKRVGPVLRHIRGRCATLTEYLLHLARVHWPPEKEIAVGGQDPDGLLDSFTFNAARLPETLYVTAAKGTPLPDDPAAEVQKIFDVFDRAISSGQPLPIEWLVQSLDDAKMQPIPESRVQRETDKADLENNMLVQGFPIEIAPYDNDELHVQRHRSAQMAVAMALQQTGDPQLQLANQAIEQHIQQHLQSATAKSAQAAPGAPGIPNGGSQPAPSLAQGGQAAGFGPVGMAREANRLSPPPGNVLTPG